MNELAATPTPLEVEPPAEIEQHLNRIIQRVYGNDVVGRLSSVEQLRQLEFLEHEFLQHQQPEMPVRHFFVPGGIAREMVCQADAFIIGAIHKHPQINVFSEGEISLLTPSGLVRMKAPFTFVTPAGTKRAGYTHSRMVWTNFVAADAQGLTDSKAIAELLTYKSVDEYLQSLPPPPEASAQIEGPLP